MADSFAVSRPQGDPCNMASPVPHPELPHPELLSSLPDDDCNTRADDPNAEPPSVPQYYLAFFRRLPTDVFNQVLKMAVGQYQWYPCTLFSLAQVDYWLAQRLRDSSSIHAWQQLWQSLTSPNFIRSKCTKSRRTDMRFAAYIETESLQHTGEAQHPRDLVRLACFQKCMLCNERVTLINWKFMVRCCERCLASNTVADVVLVEQVRLPQDTFQHLPH